MAMRQQTISLFPAFVFLYNWTFGAENPLKYIGCNLRIECFFLFYENFVSSWGWVWGSCYELYAPRSQRFWILTAKWQDLLLISFDYSLLHEWLFLTQNGSHLAWEHRFKTAHSWNPLVPCENTGKDTTENRKRMEILYKLWEGREEPKHNKINLLNGESHVRKVCKPVCGISPASMGYCDLGPSPTETLGNPSCAGSLPSLLQPQPCCSCPRPCLLTFCSANAGH